MELHSVQDSPGIRGIGQRAVRVAMIGAGGMANRVHYPSLASLDSAEIVAICDIDPGRLAATADRYDVAGRYSDYRHMVDDVKPDAVYAIGPPHHLYDVWVWLLNQRINLFVEKPLGITIHQARVLAHLAEVNGCITQVGFQRRISPLGTHMRDRCLERGPIVHAVCRFCKCDIRPFTGALDHILDDSVHAIDTLRWVCGGDVVDVQSAVRSVQVPDINFVSATLQFSTGAVGVLLNSWSSGRRIFSVEMHAPGICAEADLEGDGRIFADGDTVGIPVNAFDVAGSDEFHVYGGFLAKSREFMTCIQNGTLPGSHFGDALKTMDVAEIIHAQAMLAGRT